MSDGMLQSFSPVLSAPGFMDVQILAGMADFIRAGAGQSEGMILFIFMEEEGGIPSVFASGAFTG